MTVLVASDHSRAIAQLNDRARSGFEECRVLITRGICALEPDVVSDILSAVQRFNRFDARNDPYGEHDFGRISVAGHEVFWKMEYYDLDLQMASLDPANPDVTARVLTIMLSEEY